MTTVPLFWLLSKNSIFSLLGFTYLRIKYTADGTKHYRWYYCKNESKLKGKILRVMTTFAIYSIFASLPLLDSFNKLGLF